MSDGSCFLGLDFRKIDLFKLYNRIECSGVALEIGRLVGFR